LQQALQYVPIITNYTPHWWVPNVVVAHLKEGIEAVQLAAGCTVCKVTKLLSLAATIFIWLVEVHISF